MRSHFLINGTPACGRGKVVTDRVRQVTCLVCQSKPEYIEAKAEADAQHEAAFQAQVPRTFGEPWGKYGEIIVCKECDGNTFRMGDRTCYGHYENYHCASCGHVESRLTETGMSF